MWISQVLLLSSLGPAIVCLAQIGGPQFAGPPANQEPPAACKPYASLLSSCPPPPSIISILKTMTAPPTSTTFPDDPSADIFQASCVCYDENKSFRPAYASSIVEQCMSALVSIGGGENIKSHSKDIQSEANFCYRVGDVRNPTATIESGKTPATVAASATGASSDSKQTSSASTSASSSAHKAEIYLSHIGIIAIISVALLL